MKHALFRCCSESHRYDYCMTCVTLTGFEHLRGFVQCFFMFAVKQIPKTGLETFRKLRYHSQFTVALVLSRTKEQR